MVGDTGKVVGVDHIPELIELSRRNVKAHDERLLTDGRIELRCGDGNTEGFGGPFDAIHVGAAAAQLPESVGAAQGDDRKRIWTDAGEDEQLVAQLGRPGRMVIPVGPEGDQALFRVERDADGRVHMERLFGVRYVPLVAAGGRR
nr:Protein-L-isoaspartate(D-aspartate) O-methyltransferase [Polyrhizophydium stewartii]